ncbi:MAG: efflux RND transporter periplasmic adaptor subunit [Ectothiorhodospiraceae bacterium AqS1]|nr:efflux RND transporter periplasmic adaptor subunit [Ectothiorhodospiraceae bacterium AqS1]
MKRTELLPTNHPRLRLSAQGTSFLGGAARRREGKRALGAFLAAAILPAAISAFWPATSALAQEQGADASTTAAEGRVDWTRRAELRFAQSGIIAQVRVELGDRVDAGQILLALDPAPFDAEVDAARAGLTRLDPDIQEGERELERAQDLFERTLISDHELHLSRIALARLKAQQAQAAASLRLAQIRRERSILRAPFAGIVIRKEAEIGEFFDPQLPAPAPIAIGDPSLLSVRLPLSTTALPGWEKGLEVRILAGGISVVGRVRHIGIEATDSTGSFYPAVVEFAPPPGFGGKDTAFRIGRQVEVRRE